MLQPLKECSSHSSADHRFISIPHILDFLWPYDWSYQNYLVILMPHALNDVSVFLTVDVMSKLVSWNSNTMASSVE